MINQQLWASVLCNHALPVVCVCVWENEKEWLDHVAEVRKSERSGQDSSDEAAWGSSILMQCLPPPPPPCVDLKVTVYCIIKKAWGLQVFRPIYRAWEEFDISCSTAFAECTYLYSLPSWHLYFFKGARSVERGSMLRSASTYGNSGYRTAQVSMEKHAWSEKMVSERCFCTPSEQPVSEPRVVPCAFSAHAASVSSGVKCITTHPSHKVMITSEACTVKSTHVYVNGGVARRMRWQCFASDSNCMQSRGGLRLAQQIQVTLHPAVFAPSLIRLF